MAAFDYRNELEQVSSLCSLAQEVLARAEEKDIGKFLDRVNAYTEQFEVWERQVAAANPLAPSSNLNTDEKQLLKTELETLNNLHQRIVVITERYREEIGNELGTFHKRAKGIKKYVAPSSEAITLTGKRKG